jgi:hypothetical protein
MATYDIEALKADLPTAKELAQFVYDRTQLSLDLIGKTKEDQYLVAKNALEGKKVPARMLTEKNRFLLTKCVSFLSEIKTCLLKKPWFTSLALPTCLTR